jgi:uncharacterized membrane protein
VGPRRLHGFVDGVFAIAATLLVLDLPRPEHSARLAHDLVHQWPSYAAYVISFVTIGILWIEHHGMMSNVERIDKRFLERTLLFLLFAAIIPWPTAIAAEYARSSHGEARTAAVLYASIMLCIALAHTESWRYLSRHLELVAEPARPAVPAGLLRAFLGGVPYLCAIVVAFVSPYASFALDALVALYFGVSRTEVPGLIYRANADR